MIVGREIFCCEPVVWGESEISRLGGMSSWTKGDSFLQFEDENLREKEGIKNSMLNKA